MGNTPPVGRKVTLSDIAAGCDVSRATVSLVLRGSPLVNKHTRARVEEELRRQGYVYNRAAANLRRRTSSSIALVLNDLANPFFAEFAAGVDDVLGNAGYVTLLGSSSESTQREVAVLGSLMEHGPAGIILSPAEDSDAQQVLAAVGAQTPLLLFNREVSGDVSMCDHWDRLFLDNQHGARLATEHLIEQGHQRIAFYGGHRHSSSCQERRTGYTEVMKAAGVPVEPHWMVECMPNRLDAVAQCEHLFANGAAPTAAVCYNDAVALGLMLGLHQRGLQPGRDFALTGFDDIAEAAVSAPPLTTLAVTPRARGRQAAELIMQRLQEPSASPRQTIVPVQLLVRASSCPPHA
ncbi:LacI family DNA-binding transcriptional regulator [Dyella sp. M7H15-1]|uniref:LacI family DNA-binding transcriptional regulator n=1 Tax=Dyella sp. M7H15-1 TaxID=2501295 RepID=UPI001004E817|nr:LacI family DNA-binding transcriptional regulator [Dyella sp. M7H15-1]QAU24314.1 LacI family DNA-binding transcriptional regulator [Dyella sp. M7H15-1]